MSLKIEIDSWDYQEAVRSVQKLLDKMDTDDNDEIINIPSADEIVDLVWDKIK